MFPPQAASLSAQAVTRLEPHVSFRALEKVSGIVTPYCFLLAPLYGYSPAEFLLRYGPLITFIEAMVYQADEELEAAQHGERPADGVAPWTRRKLVIFALFRELGINDERAEEFLNNLDAYWELETELNCRGVVTREKLTQAILLRPSDLFALHHLLLHLAEVENREEIFAAMVPWQIRIELAMDLIEYSKDVATKDYNTYRMFVKLYGTEAPAKMAAELAHYQNLTEEKILHLPDAQAEKLRRIFDAVVADLGGFPAIPQPILE